MSIVKVEKLQKKYKDMTAVNGLSLSVGEGEIHGILGPNGAGKSTTINCILGLVGYDAGEILFEGDKPLRKWNRNIGYVPQDLAIYPELTPEENISFFCSLYGFSGSELKDRTAKALDFVGLTDVKNKKASEFSGGMKRRLNLACGIVHSPKLVIMDEPTVGIDPQSRNRILENVRALNEGGASVLYTTHYMPEVEEICHRVTIIDHGKVIALGTKDEIMGLMGSDTELITEFMPESGDIGLFTQKVSQIDGVHKVTRDGDKCSIRYAKDSVVIDRIIGITLECGLPVSNMTRQDPSLEEIFLSLTGKELRDGKGGKYINFPCTFATVKSLQAAL